MLGLSRKGFKVVFYDTLEDFYLAEALEYINAWKQATADNPVGICGPIGPTEQLPLVARLLMKSNSTSKMPISGEWMNGLWMAKKCLSTIRCPLQKLIWNFALTG